MVKGGLCRGLPPSLLLSPRVSPSFRVSPSDPCSVCVRSGYMTCPPANYRIYFYQTLVNRALKKYIYKWKFFWYASLMPIPKGTKRTWEAGRPRLPGKPIRRLVVITEEQDQFLERQGNASEFIRGLLDRAMTHAQRREGRGNERG